MRNSEQVTKFNFGKVEFSVKGMGVFCPSKSFAEKFAVLDSVDLKEVNKEAWKMRRNSSRTMDAHSNISYYGHSIYDGAAFTHYVAEAVCNETWALMKAK